MKLRLKNEFGAPINILEADKITFFFPRDEGGYLEKRDFSVVNDHSGVVDVELTAFEKGALKVGSDQDFFAKVVVGDEILTIRFSKGLNISLKDGRKFINEGQDSI